MGILNSRLLQFPIYVVSKGRADSRLTMKVLERMGIPYNVVVEKPEYKAYQQVCKGRILVLDPAYQREYETCDDLGDAKSKGPGPARNFAWDHSIAQGDGWHWVMDDSIWEFYRFNKNLFNKNLKVPLRSPAFFRAMEDFCLHYENVAMAGPNYECFLPRKSKVAPLIFNTRIYSCNLIQNDVPFRWRGRYNEDTILSLDMLKAGWCTVLFNAFLQKKVRSQTLRGGNTDAFYRPEGQVVEGEHYAKGGTVAKSQMMVKVHPDVSRVVFRPGASLR